MWFIDKSFCRQEGGTGSGWAAKGVQPTAIRRAFTLVELLVAMTIMIIVTGAAMIIFRTTAEHEVRQQDNLEQIQNLRAAFSTVTRDARMAGNGLGVLGTPLIQVYVPQTVFDADTSDAQEAAGWFKYRGVDDFGARAIYGTDSGTTMNESDTLTIFRSDIEVVNPVGRLRNAYTPGTDTSLTLVDNVEAGVELANGDIIALSTGTMAVILQANLSGTTATLNIGQRFRPEAELEDSSGDTFTFPAGTVVFNLKNVTFVTYYLDTDNLRLMANYHDRVQDPNNSANFTPNIATVASNIEDFQINYFVVSSTTSTANPVAAPSLAWADLAPNGISWVNAIRVGMVSRSTGHTNRGSSAPIELMGHKASDVSGFSRRMLVENIQLRNFASGS